jgi:cytochrome c oxidase assembly factor 4
MAATKEAAAAATAQDDEDAWTQRLAATGCAEENNAVLLCYADTRDWRQCTGPLRVFRACYERYRTERVAAAPPLTPTAAAAGPASGAGTA